LRFNFVVAAHLVSAHHSSVLARLASGAFYETIVLATFYEIIKVDGFVKSPKMLFFPTRPGFRSRAGSNPKSPFGCSKEAFHRFSFPSDP
jgi:hypothetical protein